MKKPSRLPIVIEKGVEIPPLYLAQWRKHKNGGNAGPRLFPFDEMEVGDSFSIPSSRTAKQVREGASLYGRRYGKKFIVTYDNDLKLRCWRINPE